MKPKTRTICLLVLILPVCAAAGPFFAYDPAFEEETGAVILLGAHTALSEFERLLLPAVLFDESEWYMKALGVTYRLGRLALLDYPVDYLVMLIQHEVFGHGSRYREMDYIDNFYHISLPPPYGDGGGYARRGKYNGETEYGLLPFSDHEDLAMILGGNEGSAALAALLRGRFTQTGSITPRKALVYIFGLLNLPEYILSTKILDRREGSNDIVNYIDTLNEMYEYTDPRPYRADIDRLTWQSLATFADPFLYFSAFSLLAWLWNGTEVLVPPMVPLGAGSGWLPLFGYELTPFGPGFYMENRIRLPWADLCADLRLLDPGLGLYGGAGVRLDCLRPVEWLELGGALHAWYQPAMMTGNDASAAGLDAFGIAGELTAGIYPLPGSIHAGLSVTIRAKTAGYVPAYPLDAGFGFRLGIMLR